MIVAVTLHISQNIVEIMLINQVSAVTGHIGVVFSNFHIVIAVQTERFFITESVVAKH